MTVREILAGVCAEWNHEWLYNEGPDVDGARAYIREALKMPHVRDPKRFMDTNCDVTTRAVCWKLGGRITNKVTTLPVEGDPTVVLVNFDQGEHFAVIGDGLLVQSYWKKYPPRATELTPEIRKALENMDDAMSFYIITNVTMKGWASVQYFAVDFPDQSLENGVWGSRYVWHNHGDLSHAHGDQP